MSRTAGRTGILPIALVAAEQHYPEAQRIIDDRLAVRMLPLAAKMFVRFLRPRVIRDWIVRASEKDNPGIWGGLLCRKCYIDEKLLASRSEMDAVVNLGAGFDGWCSVLWTCPTRRKRSTLFLCSSRAPQAHRA